VLRGGRVLDPAQNIDGVMDIGIAAGRIAEIGPSLPTEGVRRVIDARGKLVTPGLIDIHVHVYPGVNTLGIDPDLVGISRGVTAVVDAGSAGATTFPAFRDHVARAARTRVYAALNMSRIGMTTSNELARLEDVDVEAVVRTLEADPDVAVGIKVRMLSGIEGGQDLEVMRRTREAADATGVPITLHIGGQTSPLPRVLEYLRPGDVLTHAFRREGSILDANGRVYPEVREAVANGIWLDIGHGRGNLDFDVTTATSRAPSSISRPTSPNSWRWVCPSIGRWKHPPRPRPGSSTTVPSSGHWRWVRRRTWPCSRSWRATTPSQTPRVTPVPGACA
jgi:dihydroorotase